MGSCLCIYSSIKYSPLLYYELVYAVSLCYAFSLTSPHHHPLYQNHPYAVSFTKYRPTPCCHEVGMLLKVELRYRTSVVELYYIRKEILYMHVCIVSVFRNLIVSLCSQPICKHFISCEVVWFILKAMTLGYRS